MLTDPFPLLWVTHHCQTLGKLLGVWRHVSAKSKVVFFLLPWFWCTLFLGFVCYLPWGDRTYNWFIEGLNFSYLNIVYINSESYMDPSPLICVTCATVRIDQKKNASELHVSRSKWSHLPLRVLIYKNPFWPQRMVWLHCSLSSVCLKLTCFLFLG